LSSSSRSRRCLIDINNKVHHERRPSIDSTASSIDSIQEEQEDTWGHFVDM
jgi:hypothetical protein